MKAPLDDLREQFDALVARMQTPQAREAATHIGAATPEELGAAALKGFKQGAPANS